MDWKQFWKQWWRDESGLGTLEILLIIAVLVAIAVVFRKQIIAWVNKLFFEVDEQIEQRGMDKIGL